MKKQINISEISRSTKSILIMIFFSALKSERSIEDERDDRPGKVGDGVILGMERFIGTVFEMKLRVII